VIEEVEEEQHVQLPTEHNSYFVEGKGEGEEGEADGQA